MCLSSSRVGLMMDVMSRSLAAHLVQHWCEEEEILPVDQGDDNVVAPRQRLVEFERGVHPGKTATQYQHPFLTLFIHGCSHDRGENGKRALVMMPIRDCHEPAGLS